MLQVQTQTTIAIRATPPTAPSGALMSTIGVRKQQLQLQM